MQTIDCYLLLYRARYRGVPLSRCSTTQDLDAGKLRRNAFVSFQKCFQSARVKNISGSLRVGMLVYVCSFDVLACLAFLPFSRSTFGYPAVLCISHSL